MTTHQTAVTDSHTMLSPTTRQQNKLHDGQGRNLCGVWGVKIHQKIKCKKYMYQVIKQNLISDYRVSIHSETATTTFSPIFRFHLTKIRRHLHPPDFCSCKAPLQTHFWCIESPENVAGGCKCRFHLLGKANSALSNPLAGSEGPLHGRGKREKKGR